MASWSWGHILAISRACSRGLSAKRGEGLYIKRVIDLYQTIRRTLDSLPARPAKTTLVRVACLLLPPENRPHGSRVPHQQLAAAARSGSSCCAICEANYFAASPLGRSSLGCGSTSPTCSNSLLCEVQAGDESVHVDAVDDEENAAYHHASSNLMTTRVERIHGRYARANTPSHTSFLWPAADGSREQ